MSRYFYVILFLYPSRRFEEKKRRAREEERRGNEERKGSLGNMTRRTAKNCKTWNLRLCGRIRRSRIFLEMPTRRDSSVHATAAIGGGGGADRGAGVRKRGDMGEGGRKNETATSWSVGPPKLIPFNLSLSLSLSPAAPALPFAFLLLQRERERDTSWSKSSIAPADFLGSILLWDVICTGRICGELRIPLSPSISSLDTNN